MHVKMYLYTLNRYPSKHTDTGVCMCMCVRSMDITCMYICTCDVCTCDICKCDICRCVCKLNGYEFAEDIYGCICKVNGYQLAEDIGFNVN